MSKTKHDNDWRHNDTSTDLILQDREQQQMRLRKMPIFLIRNIKQKIKIVPSSLALVQTPIPIEFMDKNASYGKRTPTYSSSSKKTGWPLMNADVYLYIHSTSTQLQISRGGKKMRNKYNNDESKRCPSTIMTGREEKEKKLIK